MSDFESWWRWIGSAIRQQEFEETKDFMKRVAQIAWDNGAYQANAGNIKPKESEQQ